MAKRKYSKKKQRKVSRSPKILRTSSKGWKITKVSKKKGVIGNILNSLRPKNFKKTIRYLLFTKEGRKTLGIAVGGFLLFIFFVFAWFAKDLPSPDKINSRAIAQSTMILDRNGELLYHLHGDKNRTLIEFEEMPENIKHATVALEDKDFYKHGGFDIKGIIRSFFYNLTHKGRGQGGSTITQQLVKNALLSPEKTFTRKIKEVILSIEIEQIYKKDDILKMYLNEIPYGSNAYGIQAASKTYFDKDAKDLTLAECAVLAAIPRAPTYYSPFGQHRDELMYRKDLALDKMVEQGYISQEEADEAKKQELAFVETNVYGDIKAPHFVMYVKEKLAEKFGEQMAMEGGLKVYTTLDLGKQTIAEEAIKKYGDKNASSFGASNAALVSMDPRNGEILSMVGSRDFFNNDIDGFVNVSVANRQPGSSFKPFAYATAWKKDNWGPGSTLYDFYTDFGGGYKPKNYNLSQYGVQSMRSALQGSLNISAVKTLYLAGVKETIGTAHDMGITTLNKDSDFYGLPLVLGGGEVKLLDMATAFSTFANGGTKYEQKWFTKIEDSDGKVVAENKDDKGKDALDPQIAYLINNVLSDNSARSYIFGSRNYLNLGNRPVAAKTGTTNEYRDAWTMGYTPGLVCGVWTGNNDNTPMKKGADGSDVAAPIWHEYMSNASSGSAIEQFNRPAGIKQVSIDAITGKKATSVTKQTRTDIFPSWYKPETAPGTSQDIKICKISHKLATDKCPHEAIEDAYYASVHCELPPDDPAYWRWEAPVAAWARSQGFSTQTIPTESCDVHTGEGMPQISIASPNNGDVVGGTFIVQVDVTAPHGVSSVEVYAGGQTFNAYYSGGYYVANVSISSGNQQIKAKVWDNILYSAESSTITVNVSSGPTISNFEYTGTQLRATVTSAAGIDNVKFYAISGGSPTYLGLGTKSGSIYYINFINSGYSQAKVTATDNNGVPSSDTISL